MRRSSIVAVVLVAVLAACAGASAPASAELPEYMSCGKAAKVGGVYTGHYTSSTCSEESKVEGGGEYELQKGFGKKAAFSAKSGRVVLATNSEPVEMECKSSSTSGEFTGSREVRDVVIKASGCEWTGTKCTSAGMTSGHIATHPLDGEFGYLAGKGSEAPVVGLRLTEESTAYVVEFNCEGIEVRTQGPIYTEVSGDVNALSTESTYTFRQSGGEQQYTSFEGGGMPDGQWRWEFNAGGHGWEPEGGAQSGLELMAIGKTELIELKA
jgi:hypothetical protein